LQELERYLARGDSISLRLDQFIALDYDNPAAKELLDGLNLPLTVEWRTPRGGQLLFQNHRLLAHLKAKTMAGPLEVRRGRTAHSLIPPSGGRAWVHSPLDTPVANLPDHVAKGIMRLIPVKPTRPARVKAASLGPTSTVLNDFNHNGPDWFSDELLRGWEVVGTQGELTHVRRPAGAAGATDNMSGSVGLRSKANGWELLYVFTTNAPPFEPEQTYTKSAVYALLQCGGDYAEAARQLKAKGYGPKPLAEAAKRNGGAEGEKSWSFGTAAAAAATLRDMGHTLTLPAELTDQAATIAQRGERIILAVDRPKGSAVPAGWNGEKRGKLTFIIKCERAKSQLDDKVRFLRSEDGKDLGGFVPGVGGWLTATSEIIRANLEVAYGDRDSAKAKLVEAHGNPYTLATLPFQPEFLEGRLWNRNAPQHSFLPADGSCETWLKVFAHCGQDLDQYLAEHPWAKKHGITTGAEYLLLWTACLMREPLEPLPFLFFFGPSESGKSTFYKANSLLLTKGFCSADRALAGKDGFNGELAGCLLASIAETDFTTSAKYTYARLKDWVDAERIQIRDMRTTAYMVRNTLHFIMTANRVECCPVLDADDSRITSVFVPKPEDEIKRTVLWERLRHEAPAFMGLVMSLNLPSADGRLRIPAMSTSGKAEVAAEADPVGTFLSRYCRADAQSDVTRKELREGYGEWARAFGYPVYGEKDFGRHFCRTHRHHDQGKRAANEGRPRVYSGLRLDMDKLGKDLEAAA
jgi:hypothetical protein